MWEKINDNRIFSLLAFLFLAANWLVWSEVAFFHNPKLRVTFFDVGQGDSILIETPERHFILVDGGPNDLVSDKIGRIIPFWRKKIDLVVLTHPHADHFYGLINVLRRYQVGQVLWSGVDCVEPICHSWFRALSESDVEEITAWAGKRVRSDSTFLDVIYPLESHYRHLPKDHNVVSVVTRLAYGRHVFLLTGDATGSNESEMVKVWGDYLKSNVLKISHHGSRHSSRDEFLKAVQPEVAVIQVGVDNRYGHPTSEVIERLTGQSALVMRTDRDGDIKIISNGLNYYHE